METAKTLFINEDNAHFYIGHTSEDMTVKGLQKLVDVYAQSPYLGGILFNVNVQRALFDSRAWEPLYHDYDPKKGADQPCLRWLPPEQREIRNGCHGRNWVHNLWLLKERGIDHFAVWLERCRYHGFEGWLTVRMNDCHHNNSEEAFWHSTFWKEHPEFRRLPYRKEGWFEGAFDYSYPEVVEHHMALFRELFERYDMDGIELDWLRWVKHFKPGFEEKNAHILTDFMREIRKLASAAEKRIGHQIKIAARLPADITNAITWGYEITVWGSEKLVDMVTLAPFFNQPFYDWRIELWRAVLGEKVKILCQPESLAHASPVAENGGMVQDYRLHFGSAASALRRGADGIYLFNDCYREGPFDKISHAQPEILNNLLHVVPDIEKLRETPRRHIVSFPQICGPGMPTGSVMPTPLQKTKGSYDFGRFAEAITFRIPIGPKPSYLTSSLIIGFDHNTQLLTPDSFSVWINGNLLPNDMSTDSLKKIRQEKGENKIPQFLPETVCSALIWNIPEEFLHEDTNIVEILPPPIEGNIVWAEINMQKIQSKLP